MDKEVTHLALDPSLFRGLSRARAARNIEKRLRKKLARRHSRESWEHFESAFQILADAIEIGKAHREERFAEEYNHFYPTFHTGFLWRIRRSPEAGLAYLRWEMTLAEREPDEDGPKKGELSAIERSAAAREAFVLYKWWARRRSLRKDPLEASGLLALLKTECERAKANSGYVPCPQGRDAHDAGQCECQPPYAPADGSISVSGEGDSESGRMMSAFEQAWNHARQIAFEQDLEDGQAFSRLQRLPMGILRS